MGPPLAHHDFLDSGFTSITGFAFLAIDFQVLLMASHLTITLHIVPQAGTTILNSFLEDLQNGFEKRFLLPPKKGSNPTRRVDPRLEEGFIRIDIAYSRHKALIQKQRLDAQFPMAKTLKKGRQVIRGSKGLQAQTPEELPQHMLPFFKQDYLPELANISKE